MEAPSEDILVWPDGSWCYREERPECHWKSDDYRVIAVDTPEWREFINQLEQE